MQKVAGLKNPPLFNPLVCDYYAGMSVSVPLWAGQFEKSVTLDSLREALSEFYEGAKLISVSGAPEGGFLLGLYRGALEDRRVWMDAFWVRAHGGSFGREGGSFRE
jgi:hypothetical protein